MAYSLNKVTLIGNLGREPEVRMTNTGGKIVQLNLATSERWKDRNTGETQDKTEWHRVVVFNENLADIAERYLKKGSKVYVEGQLQTRKWQDASGQERYTTEVVINRFRGDLILLDRSGGEEQIGYDNADFGQAGSSHQPAPLKAVAGGAPILDDDIPF